jgi:hypothetical protein
VVGSSEYGDEPSCSSATELVELCFVYDKCGSNSVTDFMERISRETDSCLVNQGSLSRVWDSEVRKSPPQVRALS